MQPNDNYPVHRVFNLGTNQFKSETRSPSNTSASLKHSQVAITTMRFLVHSGDYTVEYNTLMKLKNGIIMVILGNGVIQNATKASTLLCNSSVDDFCSIFRSSQSD